MKTVGILGSGIVAKTLAKGFINIGYKVIMGTRDASKLQDWKSQNQMELEIQSFQDTATNSDIVVLAVKGDVAELVIKNLTLESIQSKIIIDTTNPIDHTQAPTNGVLPYFTQSNNSLMERLQNIALDSFFVKSFNSVGNAFMVNPNFSEGKPTMFICGNSLEAKKTVSEILDKFGWEIADVGTVTSARAIEPLCMLWCLPGFLNNQWQHAFKLLKN